MLSNFANNSELREMETNNLDTNSTGPIDPNSLA